jgi:hypothetical protein
MRFQLLRIRSFPRLRYRRPESAVADEYREAQVANTEDENEKANSYSYFLSGKGFGQGFPKGEELPTRSVETDPDTMAPKGGTQGGHTSHSCFQKGDISQRE